MLSKFRSIWDAHLSCITVTKHRIEFFQMGIASMHSKPYQAGPQTRKFEMSETKKMLPENSIKPAQMEWAALIIFVSKTDKTFWFCDTYCKRNAITMLEVYSILSTERLIDLLGKTTVLSTLDDNSGFWQVEINDANKDKTVFTSHHGLYPFVHITFKLHDAPDTFQRTINGILTSVK